MNLAARLMSRAEAGQILASPEEQALVEDAFEWTQLPAVQLKGKAVAVVPYAVDGVAGARVQRHLRFPLPMVGRAADVAVIDRGLRSVLDGRRTVVGVAADAGLSFSEVWTLDTSGALSVAGLPGDTLSGHSVSGGVARNPALGTGGELWMQDIGPGYRNELGYLTQSGISRASPR